MSFDFAPQTFQVGDIGVVAFLVLLEALLSADNALVLALMVRHLPRRQQRRALLYGLGGAFIFRFIAIMLATKIIDLWWLQALGSAYLVFLPVKHFVKHGGGKNIHPTGGGFWQTVIMVEITDIAFAIDSVLAAVALMKGPDKVWVVYLGAVIGVVLLRFAAGMFIRLLERFPILDHVAYVIVGWVAVKLAMMATHSYGVAHHFKDPFPKMPQPLFWGVLGLICAGGLYLAIQHPAEPESEPSASSVMESDTAKSDADPAAESDQA